MRIRQSQGRLIGAVAALSLTLGLAVAGAPVAVFAKAPPALFAELAQRLLPSVVNISTTQVVNRGGEGAGGRREAYERVCAR